MTFSELYNLYLTRHVLVKLRSPANVKYWYSKHGERWANANIQDITRFQVQDWVDELGTHSKSAATRAVNQLAAILGWGLRRGYFPGPNPCIGVERFQIKSRERFLMPGELVRFKEALESEIPLLRDFFWMCLLTGARRGNVQAMRWDQIDTQLNIWQYETKNGDTQVTPLASAILAILQRRKEAPPSQWVFESPRRKGKHLVEPKRAWARTLKRAGLDNLRIHDLRRTLGSYLAITGHTPILIMKVLGHKDQRSAAVYQRLNLDPVRAALETAQEIFTA